MTSISIYNNIFFQSKLDEELGAPESLSYLEEYLSLITKVCNEGVYAEIHHILPKSIFPQFIDCSWNLVKLEYSTHVQAHKLLAQAYPINKFINPLRFMRSDLTSEEYRDMMSKGSTSAWEVLKKDTEKYDGFRAKRAIIAREQVKNGISTSIHIHMLNPETKAKHKQSSQDSWTDDRRISFSEYQSEFKNRPEEKIKSSISQQKVWDERDDEYKIAFNEKMLIVNTNIDKRLDAGEKIKTMWEDQDFRDRQKSSRVGLRIWTDGINKTKTKECPIGFYWVKDKSKSKRLS